MKIEITPADVGNLLEVKEDADRWLDSVPGEINDAFFDNPYINAYQAMLHLFLAKCGAEIEWFFYEWSTDPALSLIDSGKEFTLDSIDEVVEYLRSNDA